MTAIKAAIAAPLYRTRYEIADLDRQRETKAWLVLTIGTTVRNSPHVTPDQLLTLDDLKGSRKGVILWS